MNKQDPYNPSDLDRSLSSEPRHEADRLREVWELAQNEEVAEFPAPAAIDRVWQAVERQATAHHGPASHVGLPRLRRVVIRPWMAVAATLLIAAVIGAYALWLQPVVKTATPGQRLMVRLPDGSQVELNSGTSVQYARRFGQERIVHLDGEAFFDVAEETRPFVVHTFNAQIRVLGTRFNVRAWSQGMDPGTTVALASGRVALAPADRPDQVVTLALGQVHHIAGAIHETRPSDLEAVEWATAWRNGDIIFKDQWLGVIIEEVERRFALDVTLQPLSLGQRQLTLAERNPESAEHVIRAICMGLNLQYRATSNGWEVYAPSP